VTRPPVGFVQSAMIDHDRAGYVEFAAQRDFRWSAGGD
jgi:hypothetical protein